MTDSPAKVDKRQVIERSEQGQFTGCGNPDGPKPGYKKLRTRLLEEKLSAVDYDPLDALIAIAVDKNETLEMRVKIHLEIMVFLYPKRKPQNEPVEVPLGNAKTLPELANAQSLIVQYISEGKLSADSGKALSDIVELQRKAIETMDLEKRLIALEYEAKRKGGKL